MLRGAAAGPAARGPLPSFKWATAGYGVGHVGSCSSTGPSPSVSGGPWDSLSRHAAGPGGAGRGRSAGEGGWGGSRRARGRCRRHSGSRGWVRGARPAVVAGPAPAPPAGRRAAPPHPALAPRGPVAQPHPRRGALPAAAGRAGREPPSRAALTFPVFEAPAARSPRGGGGGSWAIAGRARHRRGPRVGGPAGGLRGAGGPGGARGLAGASSARRLGADRSGGAGAQCGLRPPRPAASPRRSPAVLCPALRSEAPKLLGLVPVRALVLLCQGSVSQGREWKGVNQELRGDGLCRAEGALGFNVLAVFCLSRRLWEDWSYLTWLNHLVTMNVKGSCFLGVKLAKCMCSVICCNRVVFTLSCPFQVWCAREKIFLPSLAVVTFQFWEQGKPAKVCNSKECMLHSVNVR